MIAGWLLMLVSVLYVGALFAIAYYGDRRPLYPSRAWLRPIVYSLALAVYCSSWTFYGAVGSAARGGLSFLPIYLGPILLFVFGIGLLERLVRIAKERNITSIADFIASRFGKSHALAALVTVIAVTAVVPYLALQLKAVAMSFDVLSGTTGSTIPPLFGDSALYTALLLAVFAILFGTRGIDATEHHHGMMLAIAVESVVKLLAFVAVGVYALHAGGQLDVIAPPPTALLASGLPTGFLAQTCLAFAAMFCLPRQFQVAVVECEHAGDVRRARWLFPAYLGVISLLVLPIATAGMRAARGTDVSPDAYLLWLPLARGEHLLAVFAYIGGFSAATGMVIVASVALATMVSNDLVMPALLRVRALKLEQRADLSSLVLLVRRITIVALGLLAFLYYRLSAHSQNLAAIGLLSFAAVAQFAPAIVCGLYWRSASRVGVVTGLVAGFTVWIYTLLLPSLAEAGWLPTAWIGQGPFALSWLKPQALFLMSGWDPVTHGAFWSLLVNSGCCIFVSLRFRPGAEERLRAAAFLHPDAARGPDMVEWRGRVRVADLVAIAERIVGERHAARAFAEFIEGSGQPLPPGEASASRALVQHTERVLAGAIGAASARRMLTSALRGTGLDLSEAATLLDETSQELRFNRELLAVTFDNMLQGISVVDRDLCIVAWNRRYLDLFGYPDGYVYVGRTVADLIRHNAAQGLLGEDDVERQIERRLDHLRRGTPHVFVRERPDGRVIETRGEPLPGGGYLTTFSDVTPYKRAENALREANETLEQRVTQRTGELEQALIAQQHAVRQAEAANQSRSRFLAAASHDLLQPLNAARLFTSALRHQPLDSESGRLAERIDTAFKAAEDLLDALLESSRLEAGKYQVDVSNFALGELIDSLHEQYSVLAATRGLQLGFVGTRAWVRSDPQLLRRILQNFLANALRYTRHGGVVCGVRRVGANLRIEVWDSGPGIAEDQLGGVFDEFRRGKQVSPWGEKGLGLGLAICDRMARLLGHRIAVRTWPGHGSVFSVELPRAQTQTVPARVSTRGETAMFPHALHALCLDNDLTILDGMSALLTRWGISCDLASTMDEALTAVARRRPDLLLVDYHLDDDVDGLAAIVTLAAACTPSPPAALITADTSPELPLRARALGHALLRKPVKPAALRALIAQLGRLATKRSALP